MDAAEFWRLVAVAACSLLTGGAAVVFRARGVCDRECPWLREKSNIDNQLETLKRHDHDMRNRVMGDVNRDIADIRDEVTKLGIIVTGRREQS
jgi:hypothetical protein